MLLKELRKSRKLTQKDVALFLGIPHKTYQNYEREIRKPDSAILCKLADLYGVSVDTLFGRQATLPEPQKVASDITELLSLYERLNDEGQRKLIELADDLVTSRKYEKKEGVSNYQSEREAIA